MNPKPTLALTMIIGGSSFKEGEPGPEDLSNCLESVRPAVSDQIVIVDTGAGTKALEAIARESAYRETQKLSPIEVYPFQWVDDFSAARNYALSFIKTSWWYWLDNDDWVENPEGLRELMGMCEVDEEMGGVWLPYRYAFDEYGNCTTLHDRERLMRSSMGWNWTRRIHETVAPLRRVKWLQDQRVIINHVRGHVSHAGRNLALLFKQYEDDPNDMRAVRDIANQYFSTGEWEKATEWYGKFNKAKDILAQDKYQSQIFAAKAYRSLGNRNLALTNDLAALMLFPHWEWAYMGIAQDYAMLEDWEKAAFWAEQSRKMEQPNRILFLSPLEAQVKACDVLIPAYHGLERYDDAMKEVEYYLSLRPNDTRVLQYKSIVTDAQKKKRLRESFISASKLLADEEITNLALRLDGMQKDHGIRDVLVPALIRQSKRGTQPHVTFFCGGSYDEWWPGVPEEVGIGGSETACIEIAKRFAKDGWKPIVFNKCGEHEGEYEGVVYADHRRWRPHDNPELLVSWRQATIGDEPSLGGREKFLWNHNLYVGGLSPTNAHRFDALLGLTNWHIEAQKRAYPFLKDMRMEFVPNGVNMERFNQQVERNPFKVVYFSSPDRGLIHLLRMWPWIVQRIPQAELNIFYGWENIDKGIARGDENLKAIKNEILENMLHPNIRWRGRINQKELATELLNSQVWAYPSIWTEEFCIAALEAMAAGLYIVTTNMGALPETLGEVGIKVPITDKSKPTQNKWRRLFAGMMFAGMLNPEEQGLFRESGPARARQFTWDAAYEKWKSLIRVPAEV